MKKCRIRKALVAGLVCETLVWTACSTTWIWRGIGDCGGSDSRDGELATLMATLEGKIVRAPTCRLSRALENRWELICSSSLADHTVSKGRCFGAAWTAEPDPGRHERSADDTEASVAGAAHQGCDYPAKTAAVVRLLLSEVESMAAIVPLVNSSVSPAMTKMAARQAKREPPLTAGEFVSSYNATMTAKTGNADLDRAAAGLRIHAHGKLVRWASAGLLN